MGVKRKEREEEKTETHGSTLFISNIPYTATSTDLQTLFSDIAPVRTAFVVSDKETKKPKGVGLVTFAIKEDAETAFTVLGKGETELDGRVLRAEWAGRANKEKKEEETTNEPSSKKARQVVHKPVTEADKTAIRTIVISGLPGELDSKPLWKKVRKYDGAESIEYPIEGSPNTAHALFKTPAQAMRAAEKLHAHVFKGAVLSVILKKRHDNLVKPKKQTDSKDKAPNRNSRLIVRNLPWNITEHNLRTIFLTYGPIHSVTLPSPTLDPLPDADISEETSSPKRKQKAKARGFAFVWFLSRKDAERAVEGANGALVRGGENGGIVKGKEKEGEKEKEKDTRVIAVDWALSKERWEAEKEKAKDAEGDVDGGKSGSGSESGDVDSGSETDGGETDEEEAEVSDAGGVGVHEDDDSEQESHSDEGSSEEEEEEEEEEIKKPALPTPADGTTLFIRNVPFDATEDELRALFKLHGPLRYARLTMDNSTSPPRPRGTAFVCFWKKEDSQTVLDLAENMRQTISGSTSIAGSSTQKKNPFSMSNDVHSLPSLLTPDPTSGVAKNLVLKGRTLDVVRAVERGEAGKLLSEGVRKRRKEDKRNLYLLREGVITPNSSIAHTLSPTDLSARVDSYNARKNMLNSNPSLYVSKTRLSVRQLPRWATEGVLKRLAKHAISSFKKEVREGSRDALSPEELAVDEDTKEEAETSLDEEGKKKLKKRRLKDGPVVQSKIVRDAAKVDPLLGNGTGKRVLGRSKGYAFLELALHADALRVLRWCNNNAEAERVMKEFWKVDLSRIVESAKATGKQKKGAESIDIDPERMKMIRAKLKELEDESAKDFKPSNKSLIVEFSIENIQVVKRRSEKIHGEEKEKKRPIKRKSMLDGSFSRDEKDGDSKKDFKQKYRKHEKDQPPRPSKRMRTAGDEDQGTEQRAHSRNKEKGKAEAYRKERKRSEAVDDTKKKLGKNMGSLIGRKRKEKREKRTKSG